MGKTREEQCVASLKWILFNIGEDTKPNTFENAIKVYCQNAIKLLEEKNEKELLLKAMEQGYIWYPIDCPEDCYRYKIDCLYYNLKMKRYYLYVSDGVGEIFAEDFGKIWSIDKPVGCPNDE